MNRKADVLLSDIRNYFWSYAKKGILINLAIAPFIFMILYAVSAKGGPSMHYRPLSMTERLFASSTLPAAALLISLIEFLKFSSLMKSIKERWPTEEEKIKLKDDFAEAVGVFNGTVRIGKEYTFIIMGQKIIPTKQIRSFYSEVSGGRTAMRYVIIKVQDQEAEPSEKEIQVFALGANKKGKEQAEDLIQEAANVLRIVQKE